MAARIAGPSRKTRMPEIPVLIETAAEDDDDNNNTDETTTTLTPTTPTTTPTTGRNIGFSRLPSIKERRLPLPKKTRSVSVNEAVFDNAIANLVQDSVTPSTPTATTTTTTPSTSITTTSPFPRRSSLPQGSSSLQSFLLSRNARPTFAGIGRRVSNMVRARMAFQNRRKLSSLDPDAESNHMEKIHEMPRNPRFSTFLSPEAQYAVMKGYEDKLYDKIAHTNPESRLVLKRNKTPFYKEIRIVDNEADRRDSKPAGASGNTPAATSISIPGPDDTSEGDSDVFSSSPTPLSSFSKPERSNSMVSGLGEAGAGFDLHRSSSLPTLSEGLSHRKRLVLTYRLESAMDILDTLKRRNKENSLSPRVFRIPRQVDAVRDFNSWTKVWNKEFKVMQAK